MRSLYILLVGAVFLQGCKKVNSDPELDFKYDYVPLRVGHEIVYQVDSIIYNYVQPVQRIDTISYEWKEVITDTFVDYQGNVNYRLEYFRRNNQSDNWRPDRVWFCTKTDENFQRVEDDVRYIKLIFPPALAETWNGNAYAPPDTGAFSFLSGFNYKYIDVGNPAFISGFNFEETVVMQFVNEENLISKRLGRETYAYGVGMVAKEWEVLSKQRTTDNDWQRPENGFRIRMRVKSYTP